MTTQREALIKALEARGEKIVEIKSRKYIAFTRSERPGYFWFIGRSAALRSGVTASGSVSMPVHRAKLLKKEHNEPTVDTTCNNCGHALTQDEIDRDKCGICGHPYHDETIG